MKPPKIFGKLRQRKGQAMVEYILVAFVLIIAAYGGIEMFRNGLAKYFNKVAKIRSGPAGMAP
ncbi:MAG: hypothetical protein J7M11_00935 [Elusimicrobia bacterium]|nr:hypothetical protein [Elusimicrobiota bacterium]